MSVAFDGVSVSSYAMSGDTNYYDGPLLTSSPTEVTINCSSSATAGYGGQGGTGTEAVADYFFEMTGVAHDNFNYVLPF